MDKPNEENDHKVMDSGEVNANQVVDSLSVMVGKVEENEEAVEGVEDDEVLSEQSDGDSEDSELIDSDDSDYQESDCIFVKYRALEVFVDLRGTQNPSGYHAVHYMDRKEELSFSLSNETEHYVPFWIKELTSHSRSKILWQSVAEPHCNAFKTIVFNKDSTKKILAVKLIDERTVLQSISEMDDSHQATSPTVKRAITSDDEDDEEQIKQKKKKIIDEGDEEKIDYSVVNEKSDVVTDDNQNDNGKDEPKRASDGKNEAMESEGHNGEADEITASNEFGDGHDELHEQDIGQKGQEDEATGNEAAEITGKLQLDAHEDELQNADDGHADQ